jgi:hypothetical protein
MLKDGVAVIQIGYDKLPHASSGLSLLMLPG